MLLSLHASAFVCLGGAIGAWLRLIAINSIAAISPGLPWGMVLVNTSGSFIIGMAYLPLMNFHLLWAKYLIIGGLLGAFTTFSTFALDIYLLWDSRRYAIAVILAILVPALSLAAVFTGAALYKRLF